MEEMRQLIGRRQAEGPTTPTPLNRARSFVGEGTLSNALETVNLAVLTRLEESLTDADQSMVRATSRHETLRSDLERFIVEIKEVSCYGFPECHRLTGFTESCGS
jgi:protein ECT2